MDDGAPFLISIQCQYISTVYIYDRIYMAIGDEESWPNQWLAWLKLCVRA